MYIKETGVQERSNSYFCTPSTDTMNSLFFIKIAGEFFCNENYYVNRPAFMFDTWLIIYVREGSGYVEVNNTRIKAGKNDIIFIDSSKKHLYYTKTGWEILWIHFGGNSTSFFFKAINKHASSVIRNGATDTVTHSMYNILNNFKNHMHLHDVLLSSYINRLLTSLYVISHDLGNTISDSDPVTLTILYIKNNYKNTISLSDLASHVRLSPFYFSRIFKKQTSYSPYEYILKTRIDKAKELLKKTNMTVLEIAYATGFNDGSNFINKFHKRSGFTPKEFRNLKL